jgi:hypothetical protein
MKAKSAGAEYYGDDGLVPIGPPPALRWTIWVTIAWSALTILSNLELFGQRAYLRKALIDSNSHAKNPKKNYIGHAVDHDIHSRQVGGLIEALLVVVILILLAVLTSRGRRWARWVLMLLAVVGAPFGVGVLAQLAYGTLTSAPALYKATLILAGFAALTVVVLLLHRETRTYFGALRATQLGRVPPVDGATAGPGGSPRPVGGLGALFAPRRRALPSRVAEEPIEAATVSTPTDTGPDEPEPQTQAPSVGAGASRRAAPTRPGSVKAKGGGPRPGRSKSRQQ